MAFNVPKDRFGFFEDVDHRFRLLLHKGIITGIDQIGGSMDGWPTSRLLKTSTLPHTC